jgi:RNA polymerase sigma factor (sigma-70 family)
VNRVEGFGNDRSMERAGSDAEVLARASRHPERFGVIFDRHFATIHRYLERRIGSDGADELAGDVFRIAFERRGLFRPHHESALPWLYGLTSNLLLKHWRRERRHLHALARFGGGYGSPVVELDEVDDRLTARAARTRLLEALASLPAHDRDVVLLVAWEELSYDEVAAALDIPAGTVRSRLNRARRLLRELLDDIGNEQVMEHRERQARAER